MGKLVIIEYEYIESKSLIDKVDIEQTLTHKIKWLFTKFGLNAKIRKATGTTPARGEGE